MRESHKTGHDAEVLDLRMVAFPVRRIGILMPGLVSASYFSANENLSRLATSIVNQLLGSLGHRADWNLLKNSIEYIAGR
jgi:hypothetical protein